MSRSTLGSEPRFVQGTRGRSAPLEVQPRRRNWQIICLAWHPTFRDCNSSKHTRSSRGPSLLSSKLVAGLIRLQFPLNRPHVKCDREAMTGFRQRASLSVPKWRPQCWTGCHRCTIIPQCDCNCFSRVSFSLRTINMTSCSLPLHPRILL